MTSRSNKKLMNLLSWHVPDTILLPSWLEKKGISRDLQKYYLRSGWLEPFDHGAYKRPNDNIKWYGALHSLQYQKNLPVHIGGLTSLALQGFSHYGRPGKEPIYLFSPQYVNLPKWFYDSEWGNRIIHIKSRFLPAGFSLFEYSQGRIKLQVSSSERAVLECLYLTPSKFDMQECFQIFEGLSNLRPELLQELLEKCRSIKVKRLFFFMASRVNHQWLPYINQNKIDLGQGDRMLVRGGVYIAKYHISVPKDLAL